MSSNTRFILVLGAALASSAGAQGSLRVDFQNEAYPTAGYTGTTDITITAQDESSDGKADTNYHSQPSLAADGFPLRQSSLMHFSMDGGSLPVPTSLTGAGLKMFVSRGTETGFSVYEVLRPWDQGEATYLEASANQPWAVPGAAGAGADRGAVPIATFGRVDAGSYVEIPFTDAGVDLVRRWMTGASPNNGLIVQDSDSWDKLVWDSADGALPPSIVLHVSTSVTKVPVTDDTTIGYQPDPATGNWDGWGLGFTGYDPDYTASFVRWDVRAIPRGATVASANLVFTIDKLPAQNFASPVDVYQALKPWTERANWTTYDGTNPWVLPGAKGSGTDYGQMLGSFPNTCDIPFRPCPFASSLLAALVQQWVNDPANNQGLFIQNYANLDDLQLMDSEWRVPGQRPKLSVVFSWDAGQPPQLFPAYAEVVPGESVPMKTIGGIAPYTYTVTGASGASIDDAGVYVAGLYAGQDQVRSVDQAGAQALATVVVVNDSSTVDGGSPIVISFPNPSPPVPPQRNFSVIAAISSRAASPVSGLMLDVSGQALILDVPTLAGSGRLTGTLDAGFLLPVLDTGAGMQVLITGVMNALPRDNPSVTASVRSGPLVVSTATAPVPLGDLPPLSTGCNCGPSTGGMGVVLLAGILQTMARRRRR